MARIKLTNDCVQYEWILTAALFVCRSTKPESFADCVGDELPFGWEKVVVPAAVNGDAVYFVNHNTREYTSPGREQQF